jgi:hypothetical protein
MMLPITDSEVLFATGKSQALELRSSNITHCGDSCDNFSKITPWKFIMLLSIISVDDGLLQNSALTGVYPPPLSAPRLMSLTLEYEAQEQGFSLITAGLTV